MYMSSIGLLLDAIHVCIIYACVYYIHTDASSTLKSESLDRRAYKGKAQLSKQLCKSVNAQPALLNIVYDFSLYAQPLAL